MEVFTITNYIFLDDFSKVIYNPKVGFHLFIKYHRIPRINLGKKGILHLKNTKSLSKIKCICVSRKGITSSEVILNPEKLAPKKENTVNLTYESNNPSSGKQIPIKLLKFASITSTVIPHPFKNNVRFNNNEIDLKNSFYFTLKQRYKILFESWKKT